MNVPIETCKYRVHCTRLSYIMFKQLGFIRKEPP